MDKENETITCVYCGQAYPPGTPTWGERAKALTNHIKVCEKHPMRKAEEKIAKLRSALIDLIGAGTKEELLTLERGLNFVNASEQDKTICIKGIHALLDTMEEEE
jgi:hypothetical protein